MKQTVVVARANDYINFAVPMENLHRELEWGE